MILRQLAGSKAERVVAKRDPSQDGEDTLDSYQHFILARPFCVSEVTFAKHIFDDTLVYPWMYVCLYVLVRVCLYVQVYVFA